MKVFSSDAPKVSALDTWLSEADAARTQGTQSAAEAVPGAVLSEPASPFRDSAEALLDADVWNGASAGSRQLSASVSALPASAQNASPAQRWADHIFSPLL